MYTQNSNRDLFLSQQWSQIDSQDWNTQVSSQELNPHKVPSTPSGRVLPPTPSTSGNRNGSLSNSWSGRVGSQVVPQSISYPSTPRGFVRESNFTKDIRFALHAVLSVMKDLPAKLREIILSTSENQNNRDVICENLKKIIEEKTIGFEKVFSLLEVNESFFTETKKSQELLHLGMEEFQKTLHNQNEEVSSLNEDIKDRNEKLKKQFTLLRKLYITESKKIQAFLNNLRSNEIEAKLEEIGVRISSEIEGLKTTLNDILNHLKEKEKTEESSMSNVTKEITWLKSYIRDLPSIIDMTNRKKEIPLAGRKNVRIVESPWRNRKSEYCYSPVARVTPQIKRTPECVNQAESDSLEQELKEASKSLVDAANRASNKRNVQSSIFQKPTGCSNMIDSSSPLGVTVPPFRMYNSLPHSVLPSNTSYLQEKERSVEKFLPSSSRVRMCKEKENIFFSRPASRFRPY